jgi:prophage tail gpP-like protein
MTLSLILNGEKYHNFVQAQVTRDMDDAASSFSFTATTNGNWRAIPVVEGDIISVDADNTKILTGYVDEYEMSYSGDNHSIKVSGRSLTSDLIDSTVGPVPEYKKINLIDLCKEVAADFRTSVISNVDKKDIPDFEDILSPETGQTGFEFLESFARKRQVLLTDDENGNLVLTRATDKVSDIAIKSVLGAIDNNVISASRKVNTANLYHEYIAQSQMNPINLQEFDTSYDLTSEVGKAFDGTIRQERRYEFYTEETTDFTGTPDSIFTLRDRAQWELSIRRARNFTYRCIVFGHSSNGIVWQPNMLHQITDEKANLNGIYLCKKVIYSYGLDTGSITSLDFTTKKAYTLVEDKDFALFEEL